MEVRPDILAVIVACAIVTLLPRVLPLSLLSRVSLPAWTLRWLSHIPVAVMAALLAQALFIGDSGIELRASNLVAALVAGAVALRTRSLLMTVLAGVGVMLVWMQVS